MIKKGMAQLAKILTIEDDETTAQEIVTELSSHGFEVEWASNGKDGLELGSLRRPVFYCRYILKIFGTA